MINSETFINLKSHYPLFQFISSIDLKKTIILRRKRKLIFHCLIGRGRKESDMYSTRLTRSRYSQSPRLPGNFFSTSSSKKSNKIVQVKGSRRNRKIFWAICAAAKYVNKDVFAVQPAFDIIQAHWPGVNREVPLIAQLSDGHSTKCVGVEVFERS